MSKRHRDGGEIGEDDDDEEEEEEEEAMELEHVMEEEGTQEVVFDFDDPQERHCESIRGLLRASTTLGIVGAETAACDGLAEIAAKDPASVGTVVTAGDPDDAVAVAAVVKLQHYAVGVNAGVDAVRATLRQVSPPTAPLLAGAAAPAATRQAGLVVRGKYVNVPPRVLASMYKCLRQDLESWDRLAGLVLVVAADRRDTASDKRRSAPTSLDCDDFEDDCFAAKATEIAPLPATRHGRKLFVLHLDVPAFRAAVDDVIRLAEL